MDKDSFQSQHGAAWQSIISNPAYFAALQFCDNESLDTLAKLTPEEIRDNGPVRLAEFVGRLKLQNQLIQLSVPELPAQDQFPPETYADPTDETVTSTPSHSSSVFNEFQAEQAAIRASQPPKRRYKKRRKRKTKPTPE